MKRTSRPGLTALHCFLFQCLLCLSSGLQAADAPKPSAKPNVLFLNDAEGADEEHTDGKVASEAIRLLERHAGEPFFLSAMSPLSPSSPPRLSGSPRSPSDTRPPIGLPREWQKYSPAEK